MTPYPYVCVRPCLRWSGIGYTTILRRKIQLSRIIIRANKSLVLGRNKNMVNRENRQWSINFLIDEERVNPPLPPQWAVLLSSHYEPPKTETDASGLSYQSDRLSMKNVWINILKKYHQIYMIFYWVNQYHMAG